MRNRIYTLLTLLSSVLSCFGEVVSISSPAELIAFANRVNAGELTLDAVLTSDIDMDGQGKGRNGQNLSVAGPPRSVMPM